MNPDLRIATPAQGIDRERARWVISDTLMRVYDNGTSPNAAREAQAVLDDLEAAALVRPVEGPHLDPVRAAEVLDWCKREGGLDLYGWGDLISRLQDCIVEGAS